MTFHPTKTKPVGDSSTVPTAHDGSTWAVPAAVGSESRWTPPPGVVIQGYPSEPAPVQSVPAPHTLSSIDGTPIIATVSSTSSGTVTLVGTHSPTQMPWIFNTSSTN
jgi:hypothetical protein